MPPKKKKKDQNWVVPEVKKLPPDQAEVVKKQFVSDVDKSGGSENHAFHGPPDMKDLLTDLQRRTQSHAPKHDGGSVIRGFTKLPQDQAAEVLKNLTLVDNTAKGKSQVINGGSATGDSTRQLRQSGLGNRKAGLPRAIENEAETPTLRGLHLPSIADLPTLQSIIFANLEQNKRHSGRVLYLLVLDATVPPTNGLTITVQDTAGVNGQLWSLVETPLLGGKDSMHNGIFLAVKEPYYGTSVNGSLAVCVHHPTDLIRLSRFDPQVPRIHLAMTKDELSLGKGSQPGLLKEGDKAFVAGKLMDAVDFYSEGISRAPLRKVLNLLVKRAFAYTRLGMHEKALEDGKAAFSIDETNKQAIRLMCSSAIELEKHDEARYYADILAGLSSDYATRKLLWRVAWRIEQAAGVSHLGGIAKFANPRNMIKDCADFMGEIEVRRSQLGGRGMFAKRRLRRGDIVLVEKAIAMWSEFDDEPSSYARGLEGLLGEKHTVADERFMAFIKHLAPKAAASPSLSRKLFDLSEAEPMDSTLPVTPQDGVFNVYRVPRLVRINAHKVYRGAGSVSHDANDPSCKSDVPQDFRGEHGFDPQRLFVRGLWHKASLFNHSCLPNTHYNNIGNLMVVVVQRDVEADEELTVSYVALGQPYEERQKTLEQYGFLCSCLRCQMDAALPKVHEALRRLVYEGEESMFPQLRRRQLERDVAIPSVEMMARGSFRAYRTELQQGIPCLGMVNLLFQMGHVYLGPTTSWSEATPEDKAKAHDCFLATLEHGLAIKVVTDATSGYCELMYGRHSLSHPMGILALVGLAELAHLSDSDHEGRRAPSLLSCAKELYKLYYGEDDTFEDHHSKYSCKMLLSSMDSVAPPENLEDLKARVCIQRSPIPAFLC